MWPDVDNINDLGFLIYSVPEAVATGEVILHDACEAALELFGLARDACQWAVRQNVFNAFMGSIAHVGWQGG
jgi:hypothetical protein